MISAPRRAPVLMGGPCPGRMVSLATGSILALLEPRGYLEDSFQGHRGVKARRGRNTKKAKNKGGKARHRGARARYSGKRAL